MNNRLFDISRRHFLSRATTGIGTLALASILNPRLFATRDGARGFVQPLHHPAKAKRVIYLYQAGGPSQLETFDFKPKLAEMHGQELPESLTNGQPLSQILGEPLKCFAPQYPFARFGQAGQEMTSLFPHLGAVADDLCIIRSMQADNINHDTAHAVMNTGAVFPTRPSMGSWLLYGLGSEAENLPGFIVLHSMGQGGTVQPIAARNWHSGFLPGKFQGVKFNSTGDPVLYLNRPPGYTADAESSLVATVNDLNHLRQESAHDPEIATRIAQYEMAFRMQTSVPELMDLSHEPQSALDLYGCTPGDGSFASNCLLARRLAERGVRFIQLYHREWDHHDNLKQDIATKALEVDRASAALITDLKQRGMLDDTLIVWGGEFGRSPMVQSGTGRDHHIRAFSIWMAGGGIKPGMTLGRTDEFGYHAIEDQVHVHDFHATLLHLFGIDHTRLTCRVQGLDVRLTDLAGKVVEKILA